MIYIEQKYWYYFVCFFSVSQTGYIRTTSGNYFIEPAETTENHVTPALHSIYRSGQLAEGDKSPGQTQQSHQPEKNCGVQGSYSCAIITFDSAVKTL